MLNARRALHTRCMHHAAAARVLVDDSYVRWVEGSTSMDTFGGPERTEAVFAGHGPPRSALAPARGVRACP